LMKTGELEPNLLVLNDSFRLSHVEELVEMKKTAEKIGASDLDWDFHASELARLETQMGEAFETSMLPEDRDRAVVNKLLVRLRMDYRHAA
jgi:hypothetical protein